MAKHAEDVSLVLHIGLHKTASTYVQNLLSARRQELLDLGVLYPEVGTVTSDRLRTREGAQSGHILFTRPGTRARELVTELGADLPEGVSTVLISSEDFSRPGPGATPEQHLSLFGAFGTIQVVLVVRRQDLWVESYYKQLVDQYGRFEVRTLGDFLARRGGTLLDFHTRFEPWRELVRPENFHVLSYDDLAGGAAISRRILEVCAVDPSVLDGVDPLSVPRYDSVRPIDTVGLRLLNSYRLADREVRDRTARQIYAAAPAGEIELMPRGMREGIMSRCAPGNARIEAEWCTEPVPGFRFGGDVAPARTQPPSGAEIVAYVDAVMSLCESARRTAGTRGAEGSTERRFADPRRPGEAQ